MKMIRYLLVLLVLVVTGCLEKEADPREVDDAVGDALRRDTSVAALEARVDSLERTVASIVAQYSRKEPPVGEPTTGDPANPDSTYGDVPPPAPTELPREIVYATYRNDRLGYTIDYPRNLMLPVELLGNGNGQRFSTSDGSAVLAVYGVEGMPEHSLRELYEEEQRDPNRRVTYKVLRRDWFVISGYVNDDVFYERTLLRNGVLKTFLLLYDASAKAYFDPITEHISHSFEG